jgi:hypothetical protein
MKTLTKEIQSVAGGGCHCIYGANAPYYYLGLYPNKHVCGTAAESFCAFWPVAYATCLDEQTGKRVYDTSANVTDS